MKKYSIIFLLALSFFAFISDLKLSKSIPQNDTDWAEYLGGADRNHYSKLTQINVKNVNQLKIAWQYNTLDSGQMQCNPLIVKGILYGMTASTQPFAINAENGKEIWRWKNEGAVAYNNSRGVAYWERENDKRILFTNGAWLYAIDAMSGKSIASFGENGRVSLKSGLGEISQNRFVVSNTPGTVFNDLIIMPIRTTDNIDAASGHIQAFNIITGKLAWVFHTIPQKGEFGEDTWSKNVSENPNIGSANNWAGMAIDKQKGIVYVPTGSAAPDFYGGNRKGKNLFANCLLALDAHKGKRIWHFQFVHHDILDKDAPAAPNLMTLNMNGKKVDAVAQITKQGYIFVFDRITGNPLSPIKEKPAPQSNLLGEMAWKTQPFPLKPEPFARQTLTENDLSDFANNKSELLKILKEYRYEGAFTPWSKKGTIVFPGFDGGAEWGGAAVSPDGIMYLNSNEMAWLVKLDDVKNDGKIENISQGESLYKSNCIACHGKDLKGNPASGYPSLSNINQRKSEEYVLNIITNGKGMMPAYSSISANKRQAILDYLFHKKPQNETLQKEPGSTESSNLKSEIPYKVAQFSKFLDDKGLPAIKPPWGTLNAIDLNTGQYLWKIPFGEYPELVAKGINQTGAESYGGPLITASGLLFIGGTKDKKFRIYESKTGKLLKEFMLPFAGFATPSTYQVNGKQFVVIACGGDKLGAPKGDAYVCFSLN
jgi:quinoprotein glucose dehydrogenase